MLLSLLSCWTLFVGVAIFASPESVARKETTNLALNSFGLLIAREMGGTFKTHRTAHAHFDSISSPFLSLCLGKLCTCPHVHAVC